MNRRQSVSTGATLTGRAHIFGDHVSTDEILPGKYLYLPYDEVGQHAMAGADPDFAAKVEPGDVLVAGHNFGCGSSREAAVIALKKAGIAAVVATSFARIFFRNAVNNGLVPVVIDGAEAIEAGDRVEVDLDGREVRVFSPKTAGTGFDGDNDNQVEDPPLKLQRPIDNLQGISLEILQAGGIVEFTRRRIGAARSEK